MPAPWVGIAQVRIVGSIQGEDCVNVMHFGTNNQVFDDPSQLDTILLQLAEAMLECAIQTLLPAVTIDYTLRHVDAKRILPTPGDPIIATAPADSHGEMGAVSVPFIASLMSIRTGGGGRRGRGRIFLPPPGEPQITASAIDPGTLQALAEFALCLAGKFLGANPSSGWTMGVLSTKNLHEIGGDMNNSFRTAVSLNPNAEVKRMSSRQKGKGS